MQKRAIDTSRSNNHNKNNSTRQGIRVIVLPFTANMDDAPPAAPQAPTTSTNSLTTAGTATAAAGTADPTTAAGGGEPTRQRRPQLKIDKNVLQHHPTLDGFEPPPLLTIDSAASHEHPSLNGFTPPPPPPAPQHQEEATESVLPREVHANTRAAAAADAPASAREGISIADTPQFVGAGPLRRLVFMFMNRFDFTVGHLARAMQIPDDDFALWLFTDEDDVDVCGKPQFHFRGIREKVRVAKSSRFVQNERFV